MAQEKQIVVRRIPADLWKRLKMRAVSDGISLQEILVLAIRHYLANS